MAQRRVPRAPRLRRLWRSRKAGIAVMAAALGLPTAAICGLAIDYAQLSQASEVLHLAADSAALNAVKVAVTGQSKGDANFVSEGVAAGNAWWAAQIGKLGATVTSVSETTTITPGPPIVATVTASGQAASLFGHIFGVKTYALSLSAQASMAVAVEVVLLMDTSASMAIGASQSDMTSLMQDSPCDPSNLWFTTNGWSYNQYSYQTYGQYECSYGGGTYDGQPSCPLKVGSTTYTPSGDVHTSYGQACPNKVNGYTAYAGPPCAFACHWDSSAKAGLGNDLWAMARRKGISLRSDNVKQAAQWVISALQNASYNNDYSIGVYTFDTAVTRVYPSAGEAGSDWALATGKVGAAPTAGSGVYTDTGIQPPVALRSGTNNDTNFQEAMQALASTYLTSSGFGTSASSPKKALFLITDGLEDDSITGNRDAMPSSACQQLKDMGYTIYVAYTPYYPLPDSYYLQYLMSVVEGSGTNSIASNLQSCSSSTSATNLSTYYVVATDAAGLQSAMQNFLNNALTAPAVFTK